MYLLNEFKRKLGSKDVQKRKSRRKQLLVNTGLYIAGGTLATAGAVLGARKLINASGNLAANNKKFKNLFLKKATKNLNTEVREQIKQDRDIVKNLIHTQKTTNKPKSTDAVLSVPGLKQLYEQNKAADAAVVNALKSSQKTARRNNYGTRYEQLNQQKTGLARNAGERIAGAGLAVTGLGGIAILRNRAKKAKREKNNVSTN